MQLCNNIRTWDSKAQSVPRIPRSTKGYVHSLKIILNSVREQKKNDDIIEIPGSKSKYKLDQLCTALRPLGFVHKFHSNSSWELSLEGKKWLEQPNDFYLASIFNANLRFFSELLSNIKEDGTYAKHLLKIANEKYYINWQDKTQIYDRLTWLRDLYLVLHEPFSKKYFLTNNGVRFLTFVKPTDPELLNVMEDETAQESSIDIPEWLNFNTKKVYSIGYIPGKREEIHNTIKDFLLLLQNPTEKNQVVEYANSNYNLKQSSTNSFLTFLTNSQLVKRLSNTIYQNTKLGEELLIDLSALNLALYLNNTFKFLLEILKELKDNPLTAKKLSSIGVVTYELKSENLTETHQRLHLLKNAKLIQDSANNSFKLTNRGKILLNELNFENPSYNNNNDSGCTETKEIPGSDIGNVLSNLRYYSTDASNPDNFEECLKDAFELLGFKARWIGARADTDVLIEAPSAPNYSYQVVVEAKTSSSGAVSENFINFDSINDHKDNKHSANYAIIVALKFDNTTLQKHAKKHGIGLLSVESLITLIKNHMSVPLSYDNYRIIFNQTGLIDVKAIEEPRKKMIQNKNLFKEILKLLIEESKDTETRGFLLPRDIYHILKRSNEFKIPPTSDEIKVMLEFLNSPLIDCVGYSKGSGYFAKGSLKDAGSKFKFYFNATLE